MNNTDVEKRVIEKLAERFEPPYNLLVLLLNSRGLPQDEDFDTLLRKYGAVLFGYCYYAVSSTAESLYLQKGLSHQVSIASGKLELPSFGGGCVAKSTYPADPDFNFWDHAEKFLAGFTEDLQFLHRKLMENKLESVAFCLNRKDFMDAVVADAMYLVQQDLKSIEARKTKKS